MKCSTFSICQSFFLSQHWPHRTEQKHRRRCKGFEGLWSSCPSCSCLEKTSCHPWELKRPWYPWKHGHESLNEKHGETTMATDCIQEHGLLLHNGALKPHPKSQDHKLYTQSEAWLGIYIQCQFWRTLSVLNFSHHYVQYSPPLCLINPIFDK